MSKIFNYFAFENIWRAISPVLAATWRDFNFPGMNVTKLNVVYFIFLLCIVANTWLIVAQKLRYLL